MPQQIPLLSTQVGVQDFVKGRFLGVDVNGTNFICGEIVRVVGKVFCSYPARIAIPLTCMSLSTPQFRMFQGLPTGSSPWHLSPRNGVCRLSELDISESLPESRVRHRHLESRNDPLDPRWHSILQQRLLSHKENFGHVISFSVIIASGPERVEI